MFKNHWCKGRRKELEAWVYFICKWITQMGPHWPQSWGGFHFYNHIKRHPYLQAPLEPGALVIRNLPSRLSSGHFSKYVSFLARIFQKVAKIAKSQEMLKPQQRARPSFPVSLTRGLWLPLCIRQGHVLLEEASDRNICSKICCTLVFSPTNTN